MCQTRFALQTSKYVFRYLRWYSGIYFMTSHIMHIIIENLSSMYNYLPTQSQKMLGIHMREQVRLNSDIKFSDSNLNV